MWPRVTEVRQIYTEADRDLIRDILRKYEVEYIVIGALERSLYSDISENPVPNEKFLRSLGEAVYDQAETTLIRIEDFN